jgi:ADP-heptose:LPS heptosyltransferase
MVAEQRRRILVIKLGALGDVVLATGPFAAIRAHHPKAHITLLTTPPFSSFLKPCPWFDDIWSDGRAPFWPPGRWLDLRKKLRLVGFERVYDLQTSDRSGWYFRLMGPGARPEWSGIAPGCSHSHANPRRDFMHSIDRQREQLAMAGIEYVPDSDLSWITGDNTRFNLSNPYALLVPGGAPHRPAKRWPAARFAEIAQQLAAQGICPVVLGAGAEQEIATGISAACGDVVDLVGKTSITDIATLAQGAALALGNDTGPMHMIAAAGCASVVLFSNESDPQLAAPRGRDVTVLRRENLFDLPVEEVAVALRLR